MMVRIACQPATVCMGDPMHGGYVTQGLDLSYEPSGTRSIAGL